MRKTLYSLFFFSIFVFCTGCASKSPEEVDQPVTPTVNAEPTWIVKNNISLFGQVLPDKQYRNSFAISGMVSELLVEEGDVVNPGDPIARLDTSTLELELSKAEVDLALAEARYKKEITGPPPIQITQAAIDLAAVRNVPQYMPKAEATARAVQITLAEARLKDLNDQPYPEVVALAQAELEQAKANLERVKAQFEKAILTSPVHGTVIKVLIRNGEYAGTGQPVVLISDLRDLIIEANMSDTDVAHLQIGDQAIISFDALPGIEVNGEVKKIEPAENADPGNFTVTISLIDPPAEVRWGMVGNIRLNPNNSE